MRYLLLTQYYPPEPIGKFADLARRLAERGHHVEVLTGCPCYPHGVTYPGFTQRYQRDLHHPNLTVFRTPQWPDHSDSSFRRARYYLSFALTAMWYGLRRAARPDVIVVYQSSPPVGYAGWFLSRYFKAKLVLDVVDLWPESLEAVGVKSRWILGLVHKAMRTLYSVADRINVITAGYRERLLAMGVNPSKVSLIYQWPLTDATGSPAEHSAAIAELTNDDFNIVYAGAIGPCQGIQVVLDAAERLGAASNVKWWLLGEGTERARLEQEVGRRRLANIRFLGQRSPQEATSWLGCADALLLHLESSPMARLSIPSKTLAYLAAGKPLLCGVEGETTNIIEQAGCGETFAPGNADSLVAAVSRLVNRTTDELAKLGERGRNAYLHNFSADHLLGQMVDLLEQADAEPTSRRAFEGSRRAAA